MGFGTGGRVMIPKFRGWDEPNKTMRFNDEIVIWNDQVYINEKKELDSRIKGYSCLSEHLMQSIGLKDKNGVEIYEGDIVRYTWDMLSDVNTTEKGKKVRISKVFWSDWRASWAVGKKSCNNDLFRYARNGNTVEVIGNVWEDGDLINDSEGAEEN